MKVKDKWKRGLPYVGNKGQKVEQIMEVLPDGKRDIKPLPMILFMIWGLTAWTDQ